MTLYCGIELHSNNHYVCVIDDNDQRLLERKLDNDSKLLIACLSEYMRHKGSPIRLFPSTPRTNIVPSKWARF